MTIKKLLILIIVVVTLGGAGVFAYMSLSETGTSTEVAATNAQGQAIILPHGSDINFDNINKFNQTGKTFQYPQVTPADIGQELNAIISQ